jgi:hypothetical protein
MEFINDYFIIESLKKKDINDGLIFHNALFSTKNYHPEYRTVKTKKDFKKALIEFSNSQYKYLIISAHGDEENVILTSGSFNAYDLDELEIDLKKRRVFMSTCNGGSFLLAKYFIKKGVYSVIGTPDKLDQIVASAIWVTMAIVFERLNKNIINFYQLNKVLNNMTKVYSIKLSYFSFIREKTKMKEYNYSFDGKRERINHSI